MATKPATDRQVLESIGDEALIASGVPEYLVKSWKYRAIPWNRRGTVARIAEAQKVKLPADFLTEQRGAA